ncbi:MAG: hypothetical protein HC879_15890 [Leptolyngbyaceae cyanobacterium SL_5_9]|nr:hypothetical protein [Leptolyngbyaceae cyanobacterium SL_5_9]NJO74647.1 hypothetical protein [Leptolyngbyaceae cyanobacterium RM1_406_9]
MSLEMSLRLCQNEILFYVDLGKIPSYKPLEVIEELKIRGYQPDLRYYTWQQDNNTNVEVCALLHRTIADDPDKTLSELQEKWDVLADLFGEQSVGLVMGSDD